MSLHVSQMEVKNPIFLILFNLNLIYKVYLENYPK